MLNLINKKNSLILDFFGGSGTTGHAVLELNKEDNGNRKFILVTNNENNIATYVTYERLYRVINGKGSNDQKIAWTEKNEPFLDTKLRVIGIDDQNSISLDEKDTFNYNIVEKEALDGLKLLSSSYFNNKESIDLYYDLAALNPLVKNNNNEDK